MNSKLYLFGTLGTWVGYALLGLAVWQLVGLISRNPSLSTDRTLRSIGLCGVLGALLMFAGSRFTSAAGLHIPIVWLVLPFTGWLTAVTVVVGVAKLIGTMTALNKEEQSRTLKSALSFFMMATGSFAFFLWSGDKPHILRGAFDLSTNALLAIVALLIGGAALTSAATRSNAVRNFSRSVVLQGALLVGTFIFGLPFAWLLITSFKEERDMASTNGIVWIPKVQLTVPYLDPKEPTVEASYEGETVQASIIKKNPDGSADLDIIRPYSLRGRSLTAAAGQFKEVPKLIPLVTWQDGGTEVIAKVIEEMPDGKRRVTITEPASLAGQTILKQPAEVEPYRKVGLRVQNWPEALEYLPAETNRGLVYLKNTLLIVVFSVIGTVLSSTMVAYAFARIRFPGRDILFNVLLATMMLPGAVTLLPQFLIFRSLGWINTLLPIIVPSFFGSAFNVFLLRQFLKQVPGELEDAAKIDGCNHPKILTKIMVPAIMPALAVIAIWTFMGAWNNFMGPLIYLSTPEHMPLSYALQLFQGERSGEPGLLMAFATMTMLPVLALFFAAQKYFVEGVTLSGLGGR